MKALALILLFLVSCDYEADNIAPEYQDVTISVDVEEGHKVKVRWGINGIWDQAWFLPHQIEQPKTSESIQAFRGDTLKINTMVYEYGPAQMPEMERTVTITAGADHITKTCACNSNIFYIIP